MKNKYLHKLNLKEYVTCYSLGDKYSTQLLKKLSKYTDSTYSISKRKIHFVCFPTKIKHFIGKTLLIYQSSTCFEIRGIVNKEKITVPDISCIILYLCSEQIIRAWNTGINIELIYVHFISMGNDHCKDLEISFLKVGK